MENKQEFLKEYGALLNKYGVQGIASMEYLQENGEEYCLINYQGGGKRKVCITCDSIWCIIIDTVHSL